MTLRFSIIIPTFNEAEDIAATLDALLELDYPNYEVLVVDESRDDTPEIVGAYQRRDERIRYVRQTRHTGRSAGRNQGILAAEGEVVVVLNADVNLPVDFLHRIARHYQDGADYVLVESSVANVDWLLPRYVQAIHQRYYGPDTPVDMNWSEGFSCRRAAAIDAGLLPEGLLSDSDELLLPLVAGEDGWFGENLQAKGYRKVFDRSIVVTHVVPTRLRPFLRQRFGRGHGSGQIWVLRDGFSVQALFWLAFRLTLEKIVTSLLGLPMLWHGWQLAKQSPRGMTDLLPFTAAYYLESWANLLGIWHSYRAFRRIGRVALGQETRHAV